MLADAARRHGIEILAVVVMSNHYHAVVYDPNGVLPCFLQHLHSATGHAFNVVRQRRENFWDSQRSRSTRLETLEAIIDKVVYTLVNPVKANLVDRAIHWPGLSSYAWLDGRVVAARRPHHYFDSDGDVPDTATLRLVAPLLWEGDFASWAALIRERVAAEEERLARLRAERGTGILGRKGVLAQPTSRRAKSDEDLGELQPEVAASDPDVLAKAIAALKTFRRQYAAALARFRAGFVKTLFPAGTWALVQRYNVATAPP